LLVEDGQATSAILTDVLGFREGKRDGALMRFEADAAIGNHIDIRESQGFLPGRMGRGSVHHIAFRARDDAMQAEMVRKLVKDHGVPATEQIDRQYFRSVYFREPAGVLFEIATDQPGFLVDEPAEALGNTLKLPHFLEPRRAELEARLPQLQIGG
jgi:glyoxalase family protein